MRVSVLIGSLVFQKTLGFMGQRRASNYCHCLCTYVMAISKNMKTILQIFAAIFLISCGANSNEITNAADLARLSGALNSELQAANIEHVCSETGLQEVENFLEKKPENEQREYVLKVGAYLGECIIESYGGEWIEHEPGVWGIKLSEAVVFPIGKVEKFVADPTADSFSSFYAIIPTVVKLNQKSP